MKIYLDLEANAVTNEVISIGMVTESGDEFYSLIRPHTKLDHNIKLLTNISQEEADIAPTLETVMSSVRRFLCVCTPLDKITFIHYGKGDRTFLRASKSFTESEATKCILDYIIERCENVDKRVSRHFNRDSIGLRSAYLTMRLSSNEPATQNHNALEDAQMLKWVWENIDDYTLPEGIEPVKVARINMCYGKKKKKSAGTQPSDDKRGPNWVLTGKSSTTRHHQAAAIIPAIDSEKFNVAIVARKKNRVVMQEKIYHAMNLAKPGKLKTAQEIFDTLNKIYDALDTGIAIHGWTFERA